MWRKRKEKLDLARKMRRNPTPAEAVLWDRLRGSALGQKFVRQALVSGYIVDFYCASRNLAVEVDGWYHDDRRAYDKMRDGHIYERGVRVIRFSNEQVLENIEGVLIEIRTALAKQVQLPYIA